MAGTSWKKSPPELVEAFDALVARRTELEPRKMFGYPAGFIGGHLTTCLHEQRWIVRLAEGAREDLLAVPGAGPFEPMPGRAMREYVVLPPAIVDDPAAVEAWVDRAVAFVRTLPPKS
jgi:hypothetical protein